MIESGMVGINVLVERNWTWVSGNTYPVKEELKAQGFYWSTKRRAWYNRSIVEVKLNNNGNGHKDTFVKEKTTTKTTTVMVKAKEKTLEQEVFEYIKTKEARPLISGEWLSKQGKLGKTFLQLKPRIDDLIEDSLETEKRVKEEEAKNKEEIELSEHDKALLEGNYKIEGKPSEVKE